MSEDKVTPEKLSQAIKKHTESLSKEELREEMREYFPWLFMDDDEYEAWEEENSPSITDWVEEKIGVRPSVFRDNDNSQQE